LTILENYISSNSRPPIQFAGWTNKEQWFVSCQRREISLLSREFRTAYPISLQTDIALAHITSVGEKYRAAFISRATDLHASAINQVLTLIIFQNCDKPGRSVFGMQTGLAAAAAGDSGWATTENGLWQRWGGGGAAIDTGSTAKGSEGRRVGLQIWANSSQRSGRERKIASTNRNITTPTTAL